MATAATSAKYSDPRTRSIELAQAAHLDGTCKFISLVQNTEGTVLAVNVTVASRSSMETHSVQYIVATDSASCDCPAGARRHACAHAGAAIAYGRETARLYSPEGIAEAARDYARDLAHEERADFDLYASQRGATARVYEAW